MDHTRQGGLHSDPEYLAEKLTELTGEVEKLRVEMDVLQEDNMRKATYLKAATWAGGILIAAIGWLVDHLSTFRG